MQLALDNALAMVADGAPVSAILRAALRVATLRQDPLAEMWISIEIQGVRPGMSPAEGASDVRGRLVALVGAEKANAQRRSAFDALIARRTLSNENDSVVSHGAAELEALADSMQAIYDDEVTPGMTPLDTGLASLRQEKEKAAVFPMLVQQRVILGRIKDAAYRYLLVVESDMTAGIVIPDVVAQGRSFVEKGLALLAPDARDALAAAQDRIAQGDPEAMSHAATSCRRAIKGIADLLYPPGAPVVVDGVERVMDDDHYRNRLIEYVRLKIGRSTHADLLASNITSLGTRLKSLDDLASKGVHSKLSTAEAESCLSWTYMLAADLLRIDEESKAPQS